MKNHSEYWKRDLVNLVTGMLIGTALGASAVRVFEVNGHLDTSRYINASIFLGLALVVSRLWSNRRRRQSGQDFDL
jgi:hypothetical protein